MTTPSIGVLGGTGPLGRGLALRLAQAGHPTVLGSRDAQRAAETAGLLRADHGIDRALLRGGVNDDAAKADMVVVAVPFDGLEATIAPLVPVLEGKVVISCVNRLGFDGQGPQPIPVAAGSAAELVASLATTSRVVGAFHHVPAGRLRWGRGDVEMDVLITGDDDAACDAVGALAEAIPGMRAVRAGPLRLTRPLEELTAVVIEVNRRYGVAAGVRLAGLPDGSPP